jgi:nitroimidazol reductase NimA-like FMN-containing flavoprotein (pyridoxamine 5'-phosphate oxidase superfamily)
MFKEMRKSNREVFGQDIESILNRGEYGVLGTVGDNGYPYTVPLSYVFLNDAIYFHCAFEGHKLDNIKYNPKVSFNVVASTKLQPGKFTTGFESATAFGAASFVEGEEKVEVLTALIDKYSPEFKEEGLKYIARAAGATCIVKIQIDRLTGKVHE